MFTEFLTRGAGMLWPLASLLLFFGCFVGILLHTIFGLRDRGKVARLAGLPLEPDSAALPDGARGSDGRTNEYE